MKLLLLFALLFCTPCLAAPTLDALLRQGDAYDTTMDTASALRVYLEAEKAFPNQAEVLHRIAKQYGESMNDAKDEGKKKELASKALDAAKRAVAADANNPLAQVALAICYGRMAPFLENEQKIAYSKLIKSHAETAIKLDANCELAYHVLGAWNYELAGFGTFMRGLTRLIYGSLPEASYAAAETNFTKAISLNPKRVGNFVELGRTYLATGNKKLAKENLEKGISLPSIYRDDDQTKTRAKQALKDL